MFYPRQTGKACSTSKDPYLALRSCLKAEPSRKNKGCDGRKERKKDRVGRGMYGNMVLAYRQG